MFELRLLKLVVVFFFLAPAFFIYFVIMKNDIKFTHVITEVSRDEIYQSMKLVGDDNRSEKIIFAGFYDCLQDYKPLWKRRIPKGNPHDDYYLEVLVSSNDMLIFDVRGGEAYQVGVRSIDENGTYQDSSDSHAINCNVNLIKVVDK